MYYSVSPLFPPTSIPPLFKTSKNSKVADISLFNNVNL